MTVVAEDKTQPAAPEAEKPEAPTKALREQLTEKLKAKVRGDEPKADESDEKPAKADKPEKKADELSPEERAKKEAEELKKERRSFAKHQQKKTSELEQREASIAQREQQYEERAKGELGAFSADPLKWLRAKGVDVRQVLIDLAKEDSEDPSAKKLRELSEKTEKLEKERETEKAEKEAEGKRKAALDQYANLAARDFKAADSDEFPELAKYPAPNIGRVVAQRALEHYQRTGEELAPERFFSILEKELKAEKAESQGNPQGSPRDKDPAVAKSKPANPEAAQKKRQPATDVTNRESRIRREASSGFDRASVRERLLDMAAPVFRR